MISLAVAAAGWVGVSSPGDYAAIQFPPVPRHDLLCCGLLAGCVDTTEDKAVVSPPVTGGDLNSVAANACRAAIARETGKSLSDVAVFDVASAEAGVGVKATVAGAQAPWSCLSSPEGKVAGVSYTGSEGAM